MFKKIKNIINKLTKSLYYYHYDILNFIKRVDYTKNVIKDI